MCQCSGAVFVNKVQLKECTSFKYLGIEITSKAKNCVPVMTARLKQAKIAFFRIRNNA